jgi:hypothetical protein
MAKDSLMMTLFLRTLLERDLQCDSQQWQQSLPQGVDKSQLKASYSNESLSA